MKNNWTLISIGTGILGGGLSQLIVKNWSVFIIVTVIVTILMLIRNPKKRYLRAFYVVLSMFFILNRLFFKIVGQKFDIDFIFSSNEINGIVSFGLLLIALICLRLDFLERNEIDKSLNSFFNIRINIIQGDYIENKEEQKATNLNEIAIKHKILIKTKLENHFKEGIKYDRVIIRNYKSNDYPDIIQNPKKKMGSWVRTNIFGFYHNGLKIIDSPDFLIIKDENKNWDILNINDKRKNQYINISSVLILGLLPYNEIKEIDFEGDEYYNEPHLYCDFSYNETPFEKYEYLEKINVEYQKDPIFRPLNPNKRKKLP